MTDEMLEARDRMRTEIEQLRRALDFVALWSWRKGPRLTDQERLSAIKYHPGVKAAASAAGLGDGEAPR